MSVRLTSIEEYQRLRDSGKLYTQRARMIAIVAKRANMTLHEIRREYEKRHGAHLEIGTVSARVKGLKDDKIFVEDGKRKCTVTHKLVNTVRINSKAIAAESA